MEEENNENTEQNKEEPEIDLLDNEGHKEKLEVFEEKELPIREQEIIKPKEEKKEKPKIEVPKEPISRRLLNFYDKGYKKLMIIPFVLLIISILVIGIQVARTGSFIHKDVSLKGGVTVTITKEIPIDTLKLEKYIQQKFPKNDVSARSIKESGRQIGVIVVADVEGTNKEKLNSFVKSIEEVIGLKLNENDYSVEIMGSSLGASFFRETFIALIAAFVMMAIVVIIYFRMLVPSLAVVLCAFSDIIMTLAVVDLMGMKIGTGGIAAFLMLVGYSVDTDMLLTTRVLKRKEGTVFDRVLSSVNTGMMMTLTTLGTVVIGLIFIKSDVVRQIMVIVLIGLIADIINTWIQNVGLLRYYIERKGIKAQNVLKKS